MRFWAVTTISLRPLSSAFAAASCAKALPAIRQLDTRAVQIINPARVVNFLAIILSLKTWNPRSS